MGFRLLFGFGLLEYPIDIGVEYPEKEVPVVNVRMEGGLNNFIIIYYDKDNF